MRSIKPGRGPSGMGALGSIIAVIFGIFWTIMAVSMGAPVFFPIFGILFVILGIVQAVYHFKNATGKNRYSAFDITEEGEEPDPLEERFGNTRRRRGRVLLPLLRGKNRERVLLLPQMRQGTARKISMAGNLA